MAGAAIWTELGQQLLDAARGMRATGDVTDLWAALDAIAAQERKPQTAARGFLGGRG